MRGPFLFLNLQFSLHIDHQWCSKNFPQASLEYCKHEPTGELTNLCEFDAELCEEGTHRRCEMPQLPARCEEGGCKPEKQQKWARWEKMVTGNLKHKVKVATITVGELAGFKSSQTQLNACNVCSMRTAAGVAFDLKGKHACKPDVFCPWSDGISVTTKEFEGFPGGGAHILDGHHRWATTRILLEELEKEDKAKAKQFASQTVDVEVYDFDWADLDSLNDKDTQGLVTSSKCGAYLPGKPDLPRKIKSNAAATTVVGAVIAMFFFS